MSSMQIVFLLDLNAYNYLLSKPREQLCQKLINLRLSCLRLLTELSQKTSNFRWGFKFFDSCGSVTQNMSKFSFTDISLENFEILENEICVRYERHLSYTEAVGATSISSSMKGSQTPNINKSAIAPIKILHLALSQLLSEFQWETFEIWSPSVNKSKCKYSKRNFLFFITDVKASEEDFVKYFGTTYSSCKSKFINILLPQTLQDQLLLKADIHWIWLNTSQPQKMLSFSSGMLSLLSQTLYALQGALIPLFLLSGTFHSSELINCSAFSENKSSFGIFRQGQSALIPFSSLFHQCLNHQFYTNSKIFLYKSTIIFSKSELKIPVHISRLFDENSNTKQSKAKNISEKKQSEMMWSKFIVEALVPRGVCKPAFDTLLCLSSDGEKQSLNQNFLQLNKTLELESVNLVVTCISDTLRLMGLISPIADTVALVSLLEPVISPANQIPITPNSSCTENDNQTKRHGLLDHCRAVVKNHSVENKDHIDINNSYLKSFQIESIEPWFKPTSAVSNLASSFLKNHQKSLSKENFHKLLQSSITNKSKCKEITEKENDLLDKPSSSECVQKEVSDLVIDFNEEKLVSLCKEVYDSAVESLSDIMKAAKKIIDLVSRFFKKNCKGLFEDEVQNFMKDNFFITPKEISEKYESIQNDNSASMRIKECQIQILLTLETELLLLPPDKSNSVNAVISYLRLMSFYCGAPQLNKFSTDILRENYSHNLYSILQEIGEELDIPIVSEARFSDSPMENSSELDLFGSIVSSNISVRSSSSSYSHKDNNRKLVRRRSDISDTNKSRQVLLPGTSPKKKKKLESQKIAVRYSPRLASRKRKGKLKAAEDKAYHVRRNLFPQTTPKKNKQGQSTTPRKNKQDQSITPKKSKQDQPTTPKGSRVLKTKFVAETPHHKQNCSALKRRKSFAENSSLKVIAESPKISKITKDAARLELLQKLKNANSFASAQAESTSKSFSNFITYTPESKKRLSLKLFSKLLASPTARIGAKKCSKRLFDQVSPFKDSKNKKARYCDNTKMENSKDLI